MTSEGQGEDGSALAESEHDGYSQLSNEGWSLADISRFRMRLKHHASAAYDHRHSSRTEWLICGPYAGPTRRSDRAEAAPRTEASSSTALTPVQNETSADRIAPSHWADEDISLLFRSLSRHSRLRPDLISADLRGRMDIVEIAIYLKRLKSAASATANSLKRDFSMQTMPRAHTVSDDWCKAEDELALALQRHDREPPDLSQGQPEKPSVDAFAESQALNAILFLRHHSRLDDLSQKCILRSPSSETPIQVFKFDDLVHLISRRRTRSRGNSWQTKGSPTSDYFKFSLLHPVPQIKIRSKNKAGSHFSEAIRSKGDHTMPHRILIWAIQRGLLHPVEAMEGGHTEDERHFQLQSRRSSRFSSPLSYKNLAITYNQTRILPTSYLSNLDLVWTDRLEESVVSRVVVSVPTRTNTIRRLQGARRECLSRLFASLTYNELLWIVSHDNDNDEGPAAGRHSSSASTSPARSRSKDTYRGFSLTGLSEKEKLLAKARIRWRQNKYGRELTSRFDLTAVPEGRGDWGGLGMLRLAKEKKKPTLLAPFEPILSRLSPAERKGQEARLRSRIWRHGIDKVLSEEGITVPDSTKLQDTMGEAIGDEATAEEIRPGESPNTHIGPPPKRFQAIGAGRADVLRAMASLCGPASEIIDLAALTSLLKASRKTTYSAESSEVDFPATKIPNSINLLKVLPILSSATAAFVRSTLAALVQSKTLHDPHTNVEVDVDADMIVNTLQRLDTPLNLGGSYAREIAASKGCYSIWNEKERSMALEALQDDPPMLWDPASSDVSDSIDEPISSDEERGHSSVHRRLAAARRTTLLSEHDTPLSRDYSDAQRAISSSDSSSDSEVLYDTQAEYDEVKAVRQLFHEAQSPCQLFEPPKGQQSARKGQVDLTAGFFWTTPRSKKRKRTSSEDQEGTAGEDLIDSCEEDENVQGAGNGDRDTTMGAASSDTDSTCSSDASDDFWARLDEEDDEQDRRLEHVEWKEWFGNRTIGIMGRDAAIGDQTNDLEEHLSHSDDAQVEVDTDSDGEGEDSEGSYELQRDSHGEEETST